MNMFFHQKQLLMKIIKTLTRLKFLYLSAV